MDQEVTLKKDIRVLRWSRGFTEIEDFGLTPEGQVGLAKEKRGGDKNFV
jgi:hypothetical protein